MKRAFALSIAAGLTLTHNLALTAGEPGRAPLKGLQKVNVMAFVSSDAQRNGLSQNDVELAVRYVLQPSGLGYENSLIDLIHVEVRAICDRGGLCALGVRLELLSLATVDSNGVGALVPVWSRSLLAVGGADNLRQEALDTVEGLAKEFVVDWGEVNPASGRTEQRVPKKAAPATTKPPA